MKQSKKKLPKKEVKTRDVRRRIEARVFDRETLKILSTFLGKRLFDKVDCPVKMGKEANVFRGVKMKDEKPLRYFAVKIYRIETTSFRSMQDYIIGDPRFKNIKKTQHEFIKIWTRKEYINLKAAFLAGVSVPEPIAYKNNVLIMNFVGEKGLPFPTLNYCDKSYMEGLGLDVDDFFKKVLEDIKKMHEIGLVHADLSEYNIIVSRKGPVIIDLSQTVSLKHPKAREFLERDMFNFRKVCKKWGVDLDRSIEKLIGKVETEL